jgi:hypothetical protein
MKTKLRSAISLYIFSTPLASFIPHLFWCLFVTDIAAKLIALNVEHCMTNCFLFNAIKYSSYQIIFKIKVVELIE